MPTIPAERFAPPPLSHGEPWYEVMEGGRAVHSVQSDGRLTCLAELLGIAGSSVRSANQFLVKINGCHWNVVRTLSFGTSYLVAFEGHPHLFVLSQDERDQPWILRKVR